MFVPVAALLNTTSLYHDTLLNRVMQSDPKYKPLIPSSPHSRYTRAWTKKDTRYKWFARTLEVLRYLELFIEMGLKRKTSERTRWRVVTFIECLKYVASFRVCHIFIGIESSSLIPEPLERFYVLLFCASRGVLWSVPQCPKGISTLALFHPLRTLHPLLWHLLHLPHPHPRPRIT
jgi:hypothetical protein